MEASIAARSSQTFMPVVSTTWSARSRTSARSSTLPLDRVADGTTGREGMATPRLAEAVHEGLVGGIEEDHLHDRPGQLPQPVQLTGELLEPHPTP